MIYAHALDLGPLGIRSPNQLWVSDFTYVATWRGFTYVAFVIDVFARKIVGWRASTSMRADLVLDALEQALHDRSDADQDRLVHHSDQGVQRGLKGSSQQLSIVPVASGHSAPLPAYDNAMAEPVIGLYKTQVILRKGPWKNSEDVEFKTLEWVDWFNTRRLLEPIGYVPPVEYEAMYYQQQMAPVMVAGVK